MMVSGLTDGYGIQEDKNGKRYEGQFKAGEMVDR